MFKSPLTLHTVVVRTTVLLISPLSTEDCGYLVSAAAEMVADARVMTLMGSETLVAALSISLWLVSALTIELLDDVLHQAVIRDICVPRAEPATRCEASRTCSTCPASDPSRGVDLQPSLRYHVV